MLLQTGAACVSEELIHSLYRVVLFGMDNVESRASRGKSWRNMPVALWVTEVKCSLRGVWGRVGDQDIGLVSSTVSRCAGNGEVLGEQDGVE